MILLYMLTRTSITFCICSIYIIFIFLCIYFILFIYIEMVCCCGCHYGHFLHSFNSSDAIVYMLCIVVLEVVREAVGMT